MSTASAVGSQRALIALAGNPNTGKTTLFNRLTGSRAKVGNYPGVTVERHEGSLGLPGGQSVRVLDVPGTYSLAARSADELVALEAIAGLPPQKQPDLVLLVVDATQLTRNLYLATQVLDLGVPAVVALTMTDLLEQEGREVDAARLSEVLGVPVVPVHAARGRGIDALERALESALAAGPTAQASWQPEGALATDVAAVGEQLPAGWKAEGEARRRSLALWALLSVDDEDELEDVPEPLRSSVRARQDAAAAAGRDLEREIVGGRYAWIDEHAAPCLRAKAEPQTSKSERVDRVLLHPVLGFPLFLALMTVVFQSLFAWSDPMIGWIEEVFGALGDSVGGALPEGVFRDLIVEGVIAGVGGVIVFLPQILLLFLFIALLEDSGYMARIAFLMDRLMRALGLQGRAFVPMLSGFACAIPAILATRTMERKRDRFLTMMVVPLMTCSARLPVYGLLIAALYPPDAEEPFVQGLLMAAMYLFSTVVALACAAVLGRTLLKGPRVPLVLELPPYRLPHAPSVMRQMLSRSMVFVREAGTIILVCTIGMWALLTFPRDPELSGDYAGQRAQAESSLEGDALDEQLAAIESAENGERLQLSFGGRLGRAIEPTIAPLGFDWQIGVGILGAFAAREVFVSTMAVVYGLDAESDEESAPLRERIRNQTWPDGSKVYTPLVCFSLMAFFALACQCMSTIAVVKRETRSWRWPLFLFAYMTGIAWAASFLIYQGGKLIGFE